MSEQETEKPSKLSSRKFVVWVAWLVMAVVVIVGSVAAFIITREIITPLIDLDMKALEWFFAVSMLYMGVNLGQKAVYSISEVLSEKYGDEEKESDEKEGDNK